MEEFTAEANAPPPPSLEASDEEVVERVLAGDGALFEVLMRRHNRKLYRAVRSILGNVAEVEDAMQQAYFSAYTHLASFAGNARFSTWLMRIGVNEALGRLRQSRRLVLVDSAIPETEEEAMAERGNWASPEETVAGRELAGLIERAVDALPDIYRSVFMMRQIENLSTAETAEILDITEEVVKTRLHRARAALHDHLATLTDDQLTLAYGFDGARCDRIVTRVLDRIASLESRPK